MSSVSSRFSVVNIKDGVTISGTLRNLNGSLTQSYGTGVWIPDWSTNKSGNPIIYPDIYRDGKRIGQESLGNWSWQYNGTTIVFGTYEGESDVSTNGALAGKFKRSTHTVGGKVIPSLIIYDNLGGSAMGNNTDNDVITFTGSVLLSSSSMSFNMSRPIRFTELKGAGFTGMIQFGNNTVIDSENQSVQLTAKLYNGSDEGTTVGFTPRWTFEGKELSKTGNPITITADEVDDKLYVRCDFLNSEDLTEVYATAIEVVDDVSDDYEVFFATKVGNGDVSGSDSLSSYAELRAGQVVTLFAWAANANDPDSVIDGWQFKCKLYKTDGREYTASIPNWNARSGGYYNQTTNAEDSSKASGSNHFSAPISFDLVELCGGQLDGILVATN